MGGVGVGGWGGAEEWGEGGGGGWEGKRGKRGWERKGGTMEGGGGGGRGGGEVTSAKREVNQADKEEVIHQLLEIALSGRGGGERERESLSLRIPHCEHG